jgi:hypothetical protein
MIGDRGSDESHSPRDGEGLAEGRADPNDEQDERSPEEADPQVNVFHLRPPSMRTPAG